ncbi:hypothetical protein GCM10022217_19330 [Chryseobacterium ginsenosidimutans]|uniref:bacteriocin-like protein n=1 Tax=Chryseobacterium ginsenosidimutans TaxID=687846 RepID=UPI0031E4679F
MKNLKKISRTDLKNVFGGLLAPNVGMYAGGDDNGAIGACAVDCDPAVCYYPKRCVNCYLGNNKWTFACSA